MKVLISQKIFDEVVSLAEKHFDVDYHSSGIPLQPHALIQRLNNKMGAITLLTDRIDDAVLSQCPELRIVSNVAAGYNNIDVNACTCRKVMVTNTPGVLDDTTADLTWALLLSTARRVVEADQFLRSDQWKGWKLMEFLGHDVHHKGLGICGLGRIGQRVARRAKGFEMKILYTDVVRAAPFIEESLGAQFVDKKDLLSESDFVSLHVPLFPETTHYISDAELALMKPTAILINASRGPVVDEKALVRALQEKKIAGAGLDVYEREPEVEPELLQMKNVVLVPHIASASRETRLRMAMMAAENLVAGLMGKQPPNLVNEDVLQ
ncbi:MAG: D-glycerate dehydrogenase [Deltaproteobacteria bacterium RBG_13_47_9]|nr:MAG: D-glycerate dehydrogenase [Deltaproteobacteria bacterium RBG_13_47_9]